MAVSPQISSFKFNLPTTPTVAKTPVVRPAAVVKAPAAVKASGVIKAPAPPAVLPNLPSPSGTFTCKPIEEKETFSPSLFVLAEDYRSEDADFTIWSSDVVQFKVHSYRLQAASPYFRRLMKGPNPTMSMIIPTSGYSGTMVVKVLLDIIYTSEPSGCRNIELAFQVITLATQWECEAVLKILKKDLAIQALINSTEGPSNHHLRLAHKLKDYHLMALIAQRDRNPGPKAHVSTNSRPDDTGVRKTYDIAATALLGFSGVESPFFDLGGLSYCEFLRLPPTVLWSLARSTYLARDEQGEVNVNEMAQHFENLLHLAYPEPAPHQVASVFTVPATPSSAAKVEPADIQSPK